MDPGLSALLTTYRGDDADELRRSIQSICEQTQKPDELVIVKDGTVPDTIERVINDVVAAAVIPVEVAELPENRGHGAALQKAVTIASGDIIAIHDADDICVPDRFETQLDHLDETGADIVGGYIEEFENDPSDPHAMREVPTEHDEIAEMMGFRCPMNQTTVMARRQEVINAGNYRPVDRMEDYELWARMLQNGCVFRNQGRVLAKVRAGKDMYGRRGGFEYAREEVRLQRYFYNLGLVSAPKAASNMVIRTIPRLLPNKVRGWIYKTLLRE